MYKKVGDFKSVVTLYVEARDWQEAFSLAEKYPEHREQIYVPYAKWLAESDKFVEAQKAFHKAGRPDEAFRVLNELTINAVNECRFDDASYYYWILSNQYVDLANEESEKKDEMLEKFKSYQTKANIYYAYHTIQRYTDEPFTSYMPEALFNISRYLMHELLMLIDSSVPKGVSRFAVLYALAKQSRNLGAYKLARHVLEKIQALVIPKRFKENVDLATLMIRAKPYYDNEELLSMCYRCSTTNPLYNQRGGNRCNNCGQPFVHSFVSFEILPLVEFQLDEGISDREAMMLIESSNPNGNAAKKDILSMDDDDNFGASDPFGQKLFSFQQDGSDIFEPVVVNRSALQSMQPGEVIVAKWPEPLRYQYFRNLLPDMSITKCESCNKMFHTDDYELQMLQKGHCPFCRAESSYLSGGTKKDSVDLI